MADPTTVECASACTVTVVHQLSLPPLQLTPAEGLQLAVAIVGVWVVGFAARLLIHTLSVGDHTPKQD